MSKTDEQVVIDSVVEALELAGIGAEEQDDGSVEVNVNGLTAVIRIEC